MAAIKMQSLNESGEGSRHVEFAAVSVSSLAIPRRAFNTPSNWPCCHEKSNQLSDKKTPYFKPQML